jgi:sugar-specific transcriptional regulator TrmB
MEDIRGILEEEGITKLEMGVYLSLLKEGSGSADAISQRTGIHRRNVYDCTERLVHKGLVGMMKENKRVKYAATNPELLLERLRKRLDALDKVMPSLISQFTAQREKRETLFFRGKNGLRMIFEDQIMVGKEVLVNATTVNVNDVLKYFFPRYDLLRKKKNIKTRMIFDNRYRKKVSKIPLCKVRFVKEFNTSPMSQYVYGDNVAIVVWGDDPIAILIRQSEIAKGFRQGFEAIWATASD